MNNKEFINLGKIFEKSPQHYFVQTRIHSQNGMINIMIE